jgi:hypothetical protein
VETLGRIDVFRVGQQIIDSNGVHLLRVTKIAHITVNRLSLANELVDPAIPLLYPAIWNPALPQQRIQPEALDAREKADGFRVPKRGLLKGIFIFGCL